MRIIKRSGEEQEFNPKKISVAIGKANGSVTKDKQFPKNYIPAYTAQAVAACENLGHTPTVQEVQDIVEDVLMDSGYHEVARAYIKYRYTHDAMRQHNTTDDRILSLIEYKNEEVKQENSNKNPQVVSVQRDYMAGEVSKDLTMRMLLPKDIVEAHNAGIIHFHDADYYAQHMHNCDLLNLDDMLQNGTVISGTLIERPHRFSTACNIATQIIAQVASCQYGGQSISLTHLAKFVDVSRKAIGKEVDKENAELHLNLTEYQRNEIVNSRLRKEVRSGIQTIQYQVITLMTTNGQAPFITVFMYLNEAGKDEVLKHDLAMCIEEMLCQRYEGVKNETGVYITPAFPKLIYVLEDDNIKEGQPYYYLTKMAAKCTARRMVPDYISEKKMREYKLSKGETEGNGDVYTCMGCRSFLTPDRTGNGWDNVANAKNYDGKPKYYGRFNQGVVTINLVDVALSANKDEDAFWRIFDERLDLCHRALQCYIVCPLVDKSDSESMENVESVDETYQKATDYFQTHHPSVKIAAITGKTKKVEQQEILNAYVAGDIHILIATTIVEVGVNVPNATVMVIKNAERFGLAQLHQLRGRVGRSSIQSYCVLLSKDKENPRLLIMVRTTDGFEIAKADLEQRGAGDLIGVEQSGFNKVLTCMAQHKELYNAILSEIGKTI